MKHRPQTSLLTGARARSIASSSGAVNVAVHGTFETTRPASWCCFPTKLGWMALAATGDGVARVLMGYETREGLLDAITSRGADPVFAELRSEWRSLVERYASGERVDLTRIPLAHRWSTPFQQRVVLATRQIPIGATCTYQALASAAGSPGAARAVGQVMATNPVPLLMPCHRVLAAGGRLGGFSAPTGLEFKCRLLALEARMTAEMAHITT